MADLRDALEAQFEAAEEGTLETPIEREIESNDDPIQAENRSQENREEASGQENRDEKGRFKGKEASSQDHSDQESNDVGQADAGDEESHQVDYTLQKPTTFKKEYVPIWEKMAAGKALTPEESIKFAEYAGNIRESEYKKGVSTYKAEADNAKSLIEAISPFVGELQKQNIHPAAWINNLGRAHMILSQAPMAQKIDMFQRLAADYGIQFNQAEGQVQYQQQDPYQMQLMQQLQAMNQEVSTIKGRYEQEENQRLMSEVNRVAQNVEQFPHFETVREDMAQLLERGLANDLETAYSKAVRLRDDVWSLEQDRLLKQASQQQSKKQSVQKAKATAVSPRSVTPNGMVATSDKNKDRKSLIESQFDSFTGNRF